MRKPILVLALLLAAGAAIARSPDESEIAADVRAVLMDDPRIRVQNAAIEVREGVAVLAGDVTSLAEKRLAGSAAERILGVRTVDNRITVKPPRRSAGAVEADVQSRLDAVSVFRPGALKVSVKDGTATLSGNTATWWERDEADLLAAEVTGVRAVENRIAVKPREDIPDSLVQQRVQESLGNDVHLGERGIEVLVTDGAVTLRGDVAHAFERSRALRVCKTVAGVRSVANEIQVVTGLQGSGADVPSLSDRELRDEILAELSFDSRVPAENIRVEVTGGDVTLSGTVAYYRQKMVLEAAVRSIAGTVTVKNRVEARDGGREDSKVIADVQTLFDTDHLLADYDLRVRAGEGRVRLGGKVPDPLLKVRAGQLASYVRGVQEVMNEIEIAWDSRLEDKVLVKRVRSHLEAGAETASVASRIRVEVKDGVVVLRGAVLNWAQWTEAGRVSFLTQGVRGVENRLDVVDAEKEVREQLIRDKIARDPARGFGESIRR